MIFFFCRNERTVLIIFICDLYMKEIIVLLYMVCPSCVFIQLEYSS